MENKKYSSATFLSPFLTIKNSHLNKNDVRNIKYSLLHKLCVTSIVVAILLFLISLGSFISMGIETNWHHADKYGLPSLIGQIVTMSGSQISIAILAVAIKFKEGDIKNKISHFACTSVYIVMIAYLFLSFYSDASYGFLSSSPTVSASLALISLLIIIQPAFWREALILDGSVSIGVIALSIYFTYKYNMQGLIYYLFLALIFPIACYLIVSILFYAETQKYCEELRNEALYNRATYDELTLCKNRHSLKETLEKNAKSWSNDKESKILVMMFDIDNFKLYNDQYSHIGGDYCLKAIADCVRKTFPSPTLDFFRYGGEEFLLFVEVESEIEAKDTIEKVRTAVQALNIPAPKGAPFEQVTISIGGSLINVCEIKDFNEIIKEVDDNLYKAKHNGKNISVLDSSPVK